MGGRTTRRPACRAVPIQSDQTIETDLTEPDSDSSQRPQKRHKAGTVTVISNLSLHRVASQYGDDPPVDSKANQEDYDKSKKTIVRRDRTEVRWLRSVAHVSFSSLDFTK